MTARRSRLRRRRRPTVPAAERGASVITVDDVMADLLHPFPPRRG